MIWISLALAGPGQAGTLMPGARPMPTQGYVGVGGIVGNVENRGPAGGAAVDFGAGKDLAVIGHVHSWGITNGSSSSVAALAIRGQLVDEPQFRLAALAGAAWVRRGRLHFVPALAMEAGSDKVRFDLTLMPWSVAVQLGQRTWSDQVPAGRERLGDSADPRWTHGGIWPLGTVGIALPMPFGVDNRVRFGFPELVAWHHTGERFYFDIGGVLFGATLGPHFKLGLLLGSRE